MLPAHIIHDILEREREKKPDKPELFIELPFPGPGSDSPEEDATSEERGVAIIDFVI